WTPSGPGTTIDLSLRLQGARAETFDAARGPTRHEDERAPCPPRSHSSPRRPPRDAPRLPQEDREAARDARAPASSRRGEGRGSRREPRRAERAALLHARRGEPPRGRGRGSLSLAAAAHLRAGGGATLPRAARDAGERAPPRGGAM